MLDWSSHTCIQTLYIKKPNTSCLTCPLNSRLLRMTAPPPFLSHTFPSHLSVWWTGPSQTLYIKKPKTVAFSSDGRLMAVATRIDCRDHLAIYSTKGWKPLRCFQVSDLELK